MANLPNDVNQSLQNPLSDVLRRYILERCWGKTYSAVEFNNVWEMYQPYFHHYQMICQNCSTDDVGRLTHNHLLQAFEHIKTKSYNDCEAKLITLFGTLKDPYLKTKDSKTFVNRWILQTGKSLLLLDLCEWQGVDTLKEYLLKDHFIPSTQDDSYRIPVSLHLRHLRKIGGLKIRWTGLLSEHLSLERDDTQLAVFHQGSILDLLESSGLYPENITKEVQLTFGILLPRDDAQSRDWFQSQVTNSDRRAPGSSSKIDSRFDVGRSLKPGERNIRSLDYFRDRMISLKDLYDSHEPQTFMQHLRDYRRPTRRWGFLIAILVFLFGLGQLIEGAIQCYKSYHPSPSP